MAGASVCGNARWMQTGESFLGAILSSLAAFIAAGARPRTPLARAIVLVLVIKLIGIAGIKAFMFADSTRPIVDATSMARVIGLPTSLH